MPCTIVIKLSTSSIIDKFTNDIRYSLIRDVVTTVIFLREAGFRVVLVSSGAVGFGLLKMGLVSRPDNLSRKQVS
jgi:glutamate 5-kinase